ncbi:RNI-like protein [Neocallimastix sp. 'constans']
MKINYLLTIPLLLTSVLVEGKSDCDKINDYLKKNNIDEEHIKCKAGSNGKIELTRYLNTDNDYKGEPAEELFTYDSINKLTYTLENSYGKTYPFTTAIGKLTNLEELILDYDYYEEGHICNSYETSEMKEGTIPVNSKNLKILKLYSVQLTDATIKEIASLSNLEELTLSKCDNLEKVANLAGKLNKLNKLTIYSLFNYCHSDPQTLPKNIINKFTNLKKLEIHGYYSDENLIKEISSLTKLENLITTFNSKVNMDSFKNLANLSELELNYCDSDVYDGDYGTNEDLEVTFKSLSLPKNLKKLDIKNNNLTKIPSAIENLKKLEYLNIRNNKIDQEIPEYLNTFENLSIIDFTELKNLKGHVLNNKNLKECYYDFSYSLCKETENIPCLSKYDKSFPLCSSANTKTNITIKTKTTTTTKTKTITTTTKTKTTNVSTVTSTNGKCGAKDGVCPTGECCSKYGYCGRSEKHCGTGCQSEFGQCNINKTTTTKTTTQKSTTTKSSYPTSTNGKCGAKDGKCPTGECCSKYGYCGRSEKHCGTGCQSEFGQCNINKTTTTKITTQKSTTTKSSYPTSTNGKCGAKDGKCPTGECCSKYGYCGRSEKHCGTGCQSEFGQCNINKTTTTKTTKTTTKKSTSTKTTKTTTKRSTSTKSSYPTSTNGKCGPKDGKCPTGECCSKYNYCGRSEKHCGTGCQSEFGQCH